MGKILNVKIRTSKGQPPVYKNSISLEDYNQLALLFGDLATHGGKINKAVVEFKKQRESLFPW